MFENKSFKHTCERISKRRLAAEEKISLGCQIAIVCELKIVIVLLVLHWKRSFQNNIS